MIDADSQTCTQGATQKPLGIATSSPRKGPVTDNLTRDPAPSQQLEKAPDSSRRNPGARMHTTFRETELDRMARSGWMAPAVRELLADRGMPTPVEHLEAIQDVDWWKRAERTAAALREHCATFRFGEMTDFLRWDKALTSPSPKSRGHRSSRSSASRASRQEATWMSGLRSGDVSRFWDTTPATP